MSLIIHSNTDLDILESLVKQNFSDVVNKDVDLWFE